VHSQGRHPWPSQVAHPSSCACSQTNKIQLPLSDSDVDAAALQSRKEKQWLWSFARKLHQVATLFTMPWQSPVTTPQMNLVTTCTAQGVEQYRKEASIFTLLRTLSSESTLLTTGFMKSTLIAEKTPLLCPPHDTVSGITLPCGEG
jgi:hypothetical protein